MRTALVLAFLVSTGLAAGAVPAQGAPSPALQDRPKPTKDIGELELKQLAAYRDAILRQNASNAAAIQDAIARCDRLAFYRAKVEFGDDINYVFYIQNLLEPVGRMAAQYKAVEEEFLFGLNEARAEVDRMIFPEPCVEKPPPQVAAAEPKPAAPTAAAPARPPTASPPPPATGEYYPAPTTERQDRARAASGQSSPPPPARPAGGGDYFPAPTTEGQDRGAPRTANTQQASAQGGDPTGLNGLQRFIEATDLDRRRLQASLQVAQRLCDRSSFTGARKELLETLGEAIDSMRADRGETGRALEVKRNYQDRLVQEYQALDKAVFDESPCSLGLPQVAGAPEQPAAADVEKRQQQAIEDMIRRQAQQPQILMPQPPRGSANPVPARVADTLPSPLETPSGFPNGRPLPPEPAQASTPPAMTPTAAPAPNIGFTFAQGARDDDPPAPARRSDPPASIPNGLPGLQRFLELQQAARREAEAKMNAAVARCDYAAWGEAKQDLLEAYDTSLGALKLPPGTPSAEYDRYKSEQQKTLTGLQAITEDMTFPSARCPGRTEVATGVQQPGLAPAAPPPRPIDLNNTGPDLSRIEVNVPPPDYAPNPQTPLTRPLPPASQMATPAPTPGFQANGLPGLQRFIEANNAELRDLDAKMRRAQAGCDSATFANAKEELGDALDLAIGGMTFTPGTFQPSPEYGQMRADYKKRLEGSRSMLDGIDFAALAGCRAATQVAIPGNPPPESILDDIGDPPSQPLTKTQIDLIQQTYFDELGYRPSDAPPMVVDYSGLRETAIAFGAVPSNSRLPLVDTSLRGRFPGTDLTPNDGRPPESIIDDVDDLNRLPAVGLSAGTPVGPTPPREVRTTAITPTITPTDPMVPTGRSLAPRRPCPINQFAKPITVGKNSEIGSGAELSKRLSSAARGAASSLLGGGAGGGMGGMGPGTSPRRGPQTMRCRIKDAEMTVFRDPVTGTAVRVAAQNTKDGVTIFAKIDNAPGNGTFQSALLQRPDGATQLPADIGLCSLYGSWTLTVSWTRTTYHNNKVVKEEHGRWQEKGKFAVPGTLQASADYSDAIWKQTGFSNATQGANMIAMTFKTAPGELADPANFILHITQPNKDPVTTAPFLLSLDDKLNFTSAQDCEMPGQIASQ